MPERATSQALLKDPTRILGRNRPLVLTPFEALSPRRLFGAEFRVRDEKEQVTALAAALRRPAGHGSLRGRGVDVYCLAMSPCACRESIRPGRATRRYSRIRSPRISSRINCIKLGSSIGSEPLRRHRLSSGRCSARLMSPVSPVGPFRPVGPFGPVVRGPANSSDVVALVSALIGTGGGKVAP